MQIKRRFYKIWNWWRCYDMLETLRQFSDSDIAKQRIKIIKFYETYGEAATKTAFGADRKVICRWRKNMRDCGGKLKGLIPCSTRPLNARKSKIPLELIEFISGLRQKHTRLGKEKLKVFVDDYCAKRGLKPIGISTIGWVIKKYNLNFRVSGRVYHDPDSAAAKRGVVKRNRVKRSPRNPQMGHIVSDTIERITDGIKDYFYTAIDAKSRFALALNYKQLNSRNMADFYERFKSVYPGRIDLWQNDNGREHLGEFHEKLKAENVPQVFSYPRCPRVNGHIERFNRTIQEEFIDENEAIIHDKELFNKALADYLVFYNGERPHHSLGLKTPLQYLSENLQMSHMSLTYTIICPAL